MAIKPEPKADWTVQIKGLATPNYSRNVSVERLENGHVRLSILQGLGPRASTKKVIGSVELTEAMAENISVSLRYAIHMDDGKVTETVAPNLRTSLMEMTVVELKNIAKSHSLSVKGNKAAIVLRIMGSEAPTPAKQPEAQE